MDSEGKKIKNDNHNCILRSRTSHYNKPKSNNNSPLYSNNINLNNSINQSLFHSSLINKNKINSEISSIRKKSKNLSPLSSSKKQINNNKNNNIFPSQFSLKYKIKNKNKNKTIFNYKEKIKEKNRNNYLSNDNIMINSDSNRKIFKKIEKLKINKDINQNSITTSLNLRENNLSVFSDRSFYSLSFNEQLNKYLIKNNPKYINIRQSLLLFKEKSQIRNKINYLNNFCKTLIKSYKKNNYFDNQLNYIEKSNILYEKYKYDMKSYLLYIKKQIIKEENLLDKIIKFRINLKYEINNLYNHIAKNKFIINECKDIKKFLLKVKYGVQNIEDIPQNILALYETKQTEDINIIKLPTSKNKKNNLILNYSNILAKKVVKLPNIKKIIQNETENEKRYTLIPQVNYSSFNDNFYLTPIKYESKEKYSEIINEAKKLKKRMSYKKRSKLSSSNVLNKNPIFENPEEFIKQYNELFKKMKKSLDYYNEILYEIQVLKNSNNEDNYFLIDEKLEKRYLIKVNKLKQENKILIKQLKFYSKLNKNNKIDEIIANKIKNIILELNSTVDIEKKFNIFNFETKLESYETDNLQTRAEKNKAKIIFLMEILEKIFKDIMTTNESYKNNPIYKDKYKKIKEKENNIKLQKIRQIQINKLRKKENEKNKKIIENYTKARFLSLNKKGMTLYNKTINKEVIKSEDDEQSFKETFTMDNFFSLSLDEKNNNDKNRKNNFFNIKRETEKKEEIKNLIIF